jgi:hypothetical protein
MILDQQQTIDETSARLYNTRPMIGQVVKCGKAGKLTKVSIKTSSVYDQQLSGTFKILGVTGENNQPDPSNELYSSEFENLGTPGEWFDFILTDSPPLLALNELFSIYFEVYDAVLGAPDIAISHSSNSTDIYTDGQLWEYRNGTWQILTFSGTPVPNGDMCFKTYMDETLPINSKFFNFF